MTPTNALLGLCLLAASHGCSRSEPDHGTTTASGGTPALGTAPVAKPNTDSFKYPPAKRVVAIGDLHGDLSAARAALTLAGVLDASDHWSGGDTVVVQTGDILDRGDDELAILDLTERLRSEARKTGGAVLALSGNHELMNVAQDFRYVTPGGFAAFKSEGGRDVAFKPGGSVARRLAERPVIVQVGDTVFVHGGVLPKHVSYGIARMNDEVRAWMLGKLAEPPSIVMLPDAPIWTRDYSADTDAEDCKELAQALAMMHAKRMVVGHTPQPEGITSACDGQVYRIDTGMAHHYGGPIAALQIVGDEVTPLRGAAQH